MAYVAYSPVKHAVDNDWRGLRAYLSDNRLMELAISWGMYENYLYKMCRDYGVTVVEEAIGITERRGRWHFQKNRAPVEEQRGRYCKGVLENLIEQRGLQPAVESAEQAQVAPSPHPVVEKPADDKRLYGLVLASLPQAYRSVAETLNLVSMSSGLVRLMADTEERLNLIRMSHGLRTSLEKGFAALTGERYVVEFA